MSAKDKASSTWIRDATSEATGLEAYEDEHPGFEDRNAVVVYSWMRGSDVTWANGTRIWKRQVWTVKVIVQGNNTDLADDYAQLIDDALHAKQFVELEDDHLLEDCFNVGDLRYPTTGPGGWAFRHHGAMYEMKVRKK